MNSESYKCSGFVDDWYTTSDGCPIIRRQKALAKSTDSTSTHCIYTDVIGKTSYSQYDSAQFSKETSVLVKYAPFVADAEQLYEECVWHAELANGKMFTKCVKAFKNKDDGYKWCKCKYDAINSLAISYGRSIEFGDENSGIYAQTYTCFATGTPVIEQIIQYDSAQVTVPAYRIGKVMNINLPISGYQYAFLFDTGADRVIINKKVLRRLIAHDNIASDSLKTGKFELATGKVVTLSLVRIKEITIGDVVLKDIAAAVQEDSSATMLFGMSGIGKFKSWTMHEKPLQIIFHK